MSVFMRPVITGSLILFCPVVASGASISETRALSGNEAAGSDEAADRESWIAVAINHAEAGEPVLLLRRKDGRLWVREADLDQWRLTGPRGPALFHAGERFHALDAMPGLVYELDEPHQLLRVDAPAILFASTVLEGEVTNYRLPPPAPPGGFFNYDISSQHARGREQSGGLFEVGVFNAQGVGTTDFVARDYGFAARTVRLDTTWTQDRPADLRSVRIGDSISTPGDWGQSVRFGGVQWGTNFATQPGFIPFPLPMVAGEAALPSTVDLFVDNALRMSRDVPSGPFSVLDLPVVTGGGTAVVVVEDLLGRQQVVNLPYYVSPRLLQAGLDDYSVEAGFVRRNYGIESNDYGRFVAVGTQRHGFTDEFTGEMHAELLREQQSTGVSGAFLFPSIGVLSVSAAGSHGAESGAGGLLGVGVEHQTQRLSFGGNVQVMSTHFRQLGLRADEPSPRALSQAFVSLATPGSGAFGLSYAAQNNRGQDSIRLASFTYGIAAGRLGYLGFSAVRILGDRPSNTFGVNFTRALGERTSATASAFSQPGSHQGQLSVQRNLPLGDGFGYRLDAISGTFPRIDADLVMQNAIGTYSLDVERTRDDTSVRGGVSGGIAVLGGDFFMSRRIDQSFALVQVPGYPDVQVYADNQPVAVTDSNGNALIPRLRAYQENPLRIEQADLPLDAEIETLKLEAIPFLRSGVLATFPVHRSLGALLTIVLDGGEPLPAGAIVRIAGQSLEFPAGLRGEVYLTGLAASNELSVSWRGQHCALVVAFAPSAEPLPNLGAHVCRGVLP
ncbi:MAG: fimbria/pilus outer membrane usher protein [Rhodanobacteraceae bacterium]